jgi:hypothetical protein
LNKVLGLEKERDKREEMKKGKKVKRGKIRDLWDEVFEVYLISFAEEL